MVKRARSLVAPLRLVFGILVLTAVGFQFGAASQKPNFHVANFFGFFTILSNTFAALIFIYSAARSRDRLHGLDVLRGGATLAMALVGIIFSVLLAKLDSDVIVWVNIVLHYVMPVAVVVDWLAVPPSTPLEFRDVGIWVAFPAAYVAYTLVRGSIAHWYPYPFLNVDVIGYSGVAAYVAGILVFTVILATIIRTVGNARRTSMSDEIGHNLAR
jgi:hypothetical protein